LLHKIDGKFYTTLYAHLQDGTLKVKKGQKVTAGSPLGKMGTTGMSTGKHLHWELRLGKSHVWDAMGKNYIEPIAFFKALIAKEAAIATAGVVATDDDPVAEAPEHNEDQAAKVEAARVAAKVPPVAKPVVATLVKATVPPVVVPATKPVLKGELKKGSKGATVSYLQKALGLTPTGVFDQALHVAVITLQKKHADITLDDGIVGQLTWSKIK
jgi:murein DD-endopeptidase MepM/ murein hydrolase activator NlpD